MKKIIIGCAALALSAGIALAQSAAPVAAPIPPAVERTLAQLNDQAKAGNLAYTITEGLTTEIGPRLAGSEAEARARAWVAEELRQLRFENVRIEDFTIPYWRALREDAAVVSPAPQRLHIAALGGSVSTPEGGLEAEVIRFATLAALEAAPAESLAGKIIFVDEGMTATMDGSGYGAAVRRRSLCPRIARERGAAACLIRSVGTDEHRFAHQGSAGNIGAGTGVPAAALSNPDADQLSRLIARGPVRVRLDIQVETRADAPSGNVIAEIRGRERPDEIIVLAAHLDSWDLGTGAIDDAAGVGIIIAAAKLIRDLPRRPRRTIRLLIAGAEETGVFGGAAYARLHAAEIPNHVLAFESDFGAGRIWQLRTRFGTGAQPYALAMHRALAPAGVFVMGGTAYGGADVAALRDAGVPVLDLAQDGLDYFDYHHTADDTLDKVDPENLRFNVVAWAMIAYLAAEMDWDFRAAQ